MLKLNKVYNLDVREGLKLLDPESIDCVITSPPYWSLRDYGIPPSVWGGDPECKHEFVLEIVKGEGYTSSKRWQHKESRESNPQGWSTEISEIGFCSKCGAWKGTLGLEPNFEMFITHLCDIYDGVKRVLKKSGTCWVNLGDTYSSKGGKQRTPEEYLKDQKRAKRKGYTSGGFGEGNNSQGRSGRNPINTVKQGVQAKSLLMLPQRFAIEMINRGWILRNVIIWHKPNAMPSSARDRFTVDFEYVYFFVKNKKYWFEQQRVPQSPHTLKAFKNGIIPQNPKTINNPDEIKAGKTKQSMTIGRVWKALVPGGRNMRTVWKIPTHPNPEAHFATFPPKLVEPMIKSGCPEFVCKVCGKPREKIIERTRKLEPHRKVIGLGPKSLQKGGTLHHNIFDELKGFTDCGCETPKTKTSSKKAIEAFQGHPPTNYYRMGETNKKIVGLTDCNHGLKWKSGIVLDIFAGTGTTLKEAWRLGRNYIGFEISEEYCEIANRLLNSTKNKRLDDFF